MSERKVLNKYYPPDFDPSKLPRVKREKNRQFTIRLMAPFNMRCTTCGEYIYRGKKFNARKEDVLGKTYLGIQVYRFYIKCTKCLAEITFLTDPENQDYAMENGAMRNFESVRLAEKQADQEAKQEKEDEANNPMKLLENRTRDSRREMAILETLEDIKELNMKNINYDPLEIIRKEEMKLKEDYEEEIRRQLENDEREIKNIVMKQKLLRDNVDDDEDGAVTMKKIKVDLKPQVNETTRQQQMKKANVSLYIKKKDETVATKSVVTNSQQQVQTKPAAALSSLLSAYDDDDDSSD